MEVVYKERLLPFIVGAGNGFLIGHGFALFGCAFHSLNNAPHGHKVQDFLTRLPSSAFANSVQMASWSIVSSTVEPFITPHVKEGWAQNLAIGAATGALLECRCGISGMLTGAYSGAMQSITMSLFNHAVGSVIKPVRSYQINRQKNDFLKKRSNEVFVDPFQAMITAFTRK